MLRFLRKIRKGFKTACLSAALATCWQVGQTAKADMSPLYDYGDEVTVKFTGTVSPATKSLSHLFLLYGTGYSSFESGLFAINLGDFTASQSSPFSVQGTAIYAESTFWIVAGLYGNLSGGEYIEGINGVMLGIEAAEGAQWGWYSSYDEGAIFTELLNDAPGSMFSGFLQGESSHAQYMTLLEFTDSGVLWNFSNASNNGQIEITSQIVPEPVSIVLFGTGGMIVVALRRRGE